MHLSDPSLFIKLVLAIGCLLPMLLALPSLLFNSDERPFGDGGFQGTVKNADSPLGPRVRVDWSLPGSLCGGLRQRGVAPSRIGI